MTTLTITIKHDDLIYESYVNSEGNVYIGEIDVDNPYASFVVIPKDDWKSFVSFINSQINEEG